MAAKKKAKTTKVQARKNPQQVVPATEVMQGFAGGAMRSNNVARPDPVGYISPLAMAGFHDYMLRNQRMADGRMRRSDNWKAGMPCPRYMTSLLRHAHDTHTHWDSLKHGYAEDDYEALKALKEALYGIMFNAQGLLHEIEMGADLLIEDGPGR